MLSTIAIICRIWNVAVCSVCTVNGQDGYTSDFELHWNLTVAMDLYHDNNVVHGDHPANIEYWPDYMDCYGLSDVVMVDYTIV